MFDVPTHLFLIVCSSCNHVHSACIVLAIMVGVASERRICWIRLPPPPHPGAPQTPPPTSLQPCTAAVQPADRSCQAQAFIAWQPFACLAGLCLENLSATATLLKATLPLSCQALELHMTWPKRQQHIVIARHSAAQQHRSSTAGLPHIC